jgi:DNA-directed RNA polymerase specialized sigma24 family protein
MNLDSEIVSLRQDTRVLSGTTQLSISKRARNTGRQAYELPGASSWNIDQASFNQLLFWLDPNPEIAGQKYETIRRKMITLFTNRRCIYAEDLADETFNRVTRRLPQIKEYYVGNPLNYFFGVARKIYLEYLRSISVRRPASFPAAEAEVGQLFEHLEECVGRLHHKDRELIFTYYEGNGRTKIKHRKKLAEELGISVNALRLRVHRIVHHLRKQANNISTDTSL